MTMTKAVVTASDTTVLTSYTFLPFWNFFAAIFVYYLFLEGLKKLGLVKSK